MSTSPFNWQGPSKTGKSLAKKPNKPGTLPPIVLAGTPKWKKPIDQGAKK